MIRETMYQLAKMLFTKPGIAITGIIFILLVTLYCWIHPRKITVKSIIMLVLQSIVCTFCLLLITLSTLTTQENSLALISIAILAGAWIFEILVKKVNTLIKGKNHGKPEKHRTAD